ncbi:MAG TPA: ABC transporter substrate-binding protein [Thermoplasmata archaeon]|nr:ABC transporter substrate-binding protein [Thermoplasmata archaeon]
MSAQATGGSPAPPATTAGQDYTRRAKRSSAVWAIVVVVVAIAAGLGGYYYGHSTAASTSSSSATVTYYDDLSSSEATFMTQVLIPQFEAAHPNIGINYVNIDASDMVTKVAALVQANDVGTTLLAEDNLDIGELLYSSTGNDLMNLTSIASVIQPTTMIPSMTGVTTYETHAFGGEYFIPFRANTPLVWLNTTALGAAGLSTTQGPQTFADLLSDAQTLSSKGDATPVMFQGGAGDDTATEMFQWEVQFGGNPMVYNDFGDLQAMSYLYNLSAYMNPGYKQAIYSEYAGLAQGKYQILDYQWPYVYSLLTGGNTSITPMNANTLLVYPGPNGTGAQASDHVIGGDVLAIPKGATNLWAIETFAQYLLSAPAQQLLMVDTGNPAVNAAAYIGLPGDQSTVDIAIEQALENPVFRPPVPWIETWVADFYNDIFTPFVLNNLGTGSWSALVGDAGTANSALSAYLTANYGSSVASQYAAGDFGPLYV